MSAVVLALALRLRLAAAAGLMLSLALCPATALAQGAPSGDGGAPPSDSPLYAPHRDAGGFFNPWRRFERPSLFDFLRWKLAGSAYEKRGVPAIPRIENDGRGLAGIENSASVTWVGHATFAVHDGDDVFLTDPHFSARALIPERAVPPACRSRRFPPTPSRSSPTITTTISTRTR